MLSRRAVVSGPVAARSVAALLAPTLGWERSVDVVGATVRRLRLDAEALGPDDIISVLEDLGHEPGIVGVTARFALSRSTTSRMNIVAAAPSSESSEPPPPPASTPPDSRAAAVLVTTLSVHEIVAQLAPMLGLDKTEAAIHTCVTRLGLPRDRLDHEQVERLLDDLARQEGLVGMTARFARGRVMARFNG